jgi:Zn-dependent peptidase ImmA (M78 family)/transcriptional regulator with XRE-family HTH domain
MTIDQQILASRLREARLAAGLTQEQAAASLELPRTAVVQIEAGNRAVSTIELARLAGLYGRPIGSFFEDVSLSEEEDPLIALLRAAGDVGDHPKWRKEITRYLAICREGVLLEQSLGLPAHEGPPTYPTPRPSRVMTAVEQGSRIAEQERRRLGIGINPIPDMSDLINGQNVWASGAKLPDAMSGMFLRHSAIGLCILVNYDHVRTRKRFSYAHEYAHALLDREQTASVTLEQNKSDLTEVRANAFAAAFLLPRAGVWAFLNARAKAGPSVVDQAVYDPSTETDGDEVRGHRRASPGSQDLSFEDVAALAQHFDVSYQAALYRLKSLSVINGTQFDTLREKEHFGRSYLELLEMFDDVRGRDERKPDREIVSQIVYLALEAYRQENLSKAKLKELSSLLNVSAKMMLELAEAV